MTLYVCVYLRKPSDMSVSFPLCIWAKSKPKYLLSGGSLQAFMRLHHGSKLHGLWLRESGEGEGQRRKVFGKQKRKPKNREIQGSLKNKNVKSSHRYDNRWNSWIRHDTASTEVDDFQFMFPHRLSGVEFKSLKMQNVGIDVYIIQLLAKIVNII